MKLTPLQRERAERMVAWSLAWYGLAPWERDNYVKQSKRIVADLEAVATHGATDKRAAEALLRVVEESA